MDERDSSDPQAYRIGIAWDLQMIRPYVRKRYWWGVRYVLLHRMPKNARRRSWWGLWQFERPGCERAVRGLTKRHAERRGHRVWLDGGKG